MKLMIASGYMIGGCILAAGCSGGSGVEGAAVPGPTITMIDSIVLAEPSGDPLGGYAGFFGVTGTGDVIVSDITSRRVLRFDATGAFLGQIGREGEGPGEFRLPGDICAKVGKVDLA